MADEEWHLSRYFEHGEGVGLHQGLAPGVENARHSGEAQSFFIFGFEHLVTLAVIVLVTVLLCRWARRGPGRPAVRRVSLAMAGIQAVNQLTWHGRMIFQGSWTLQDSLPLHLCDAAVIATILALWRPTRLRFELCYFWSFAGALQALLTPDITDGFPHYFFCQFFLTHGGLVVSGAWLAFGCGMRPGPGAVLRVLLLTNLWAGLASGANVLFGANYMFLAQKPPTGSLLDLFGPWPWYIAVCEVLALALMWSLSLPFRGGRG